MKTKYPFDINCLRQLHVLNKTEEDKELPWECFKVFDYCKEKGDYNNSNRMCLVKWNDINKFKSWVDFCIKPH
jgi:hypothetical protein